MFQPELGIKENCYKMMYCGHYLSAQPMSTSFLKSKGGLIV